MTALSDAIHHSSVAFAWFKISSTQKGKFELVVRIRGVNLALGLGQSYS